MKKNNQNTNKSYLIVFLCIILLTAASVGSAIMISTNTTAIYNRYLNTLKSGYIADETVYVYSTVDIIDAKATAELKNQAALSIPTVFSFNVANSEKMLYNYEYLSSQNEVTNQNIISVAYEILSEIIKQGYFDEIELSQMKLLENNKILIINIPYDVYANSQRVVDTDSLLSSSNIDQYILEQAAKYSDIISPSNYKELLTFVKYCLVVNVFEDTVITTYRRDLAMSQVEPVVESYTKGEVIIPVDTVITENEIDVIRSLADSSKFDIREYWGQGIFCLAGFIATVLGFYFVARHSGIHYMTYIGIFTVSTLLVIGVATYLSLKFSYLELNSTEVFFAVCFVPMLVTALSSKKSLGFISAAAIGIAMVISPGANVYTFFYAVSVGSFCSYTIRFMNRRLDSLLQFFLSIAGSVMITTFCIVIEASSIPDMMDILVITAARTALSNLILFGAIPVLEKVFNLPTVFRLHELAYTDSPLLVRLAKAAPGTYSHSRSVAELAQEAAAKVGANYGIAMVGGLYHDIGKTDHPEYFVENQSGNNKHDEINPTLSASIIRNHVKSGADKAREARLPAEIIDIIANHHGNDVIRYFLHEANENKGKNRIVEESDFRYNAEPPSTKECAIVMIADSVEAAARTINDPTPAKFSKLIRAIILSKVEHHQLDNCNLSMKDLNIISESLLKTLTAQYHARIEYPDEENKK